MDIKNYSQNRLAVWVGIYAIAQLEKKRPNGSYCVFDRHPDGTDIYEITFEDAMSILQELVDSKEFISMFCGDKNFLESDR